jgi:class 3 adenylate cyclase/tetratricopeptide (TPR) repeat protein
MSDIHNWLNQLGLARYADAFEENDVDIDVLGEISDDDLKALGVSLGDRRRITRAARELRQGPGDISTATDTATQSGRGDMALQDAAPVSYTPRHLAERILTGRSSLEGERKQVTVLFADVAGFTALSERLDPEVVHTIMDGCFSILGEQVHHYEGTINQYTGDGIMALFGAPIAHEDHALRAAHAALGIQEALAEYGAAVERQWKVPFRMRVGLNTGPVIVGRIGDDLRMDYTAQGDTVNLAARLQQLAEPGAIAVAQAIYRIGEEMFEWADLGHHEVHGKSAPVPVYRLTGRGAAHGRFDVLVRRGLTPLVGRDEELGVLTQAWANAGTGAGRVVSVVGEAGLGKSRLLYEFKRHLGAENARFIEGTCFTYGESISYLPFLEVVRSLCGIADGADETAGKRTITATIDRLGLSADKVEPYLHNLLSYAVDDPVFSRLTAELVRRRTVEALTVLLFAEAAAAPLALIIEDVHWIDTATEEVIGAVVEALSQAPMLLVLVYRPEYLRQWGETADHAEVVLRQLQSASGAAMVRAILAKPYTTDLALEPLSAEQSTAVARRILGEGAIAPELERLIVKRTEGNPLFVEELTRSLIEDGALREDGGAYALARPVEELDIPPTLQGVLLARIDRLPDELKETLQVAAAIGRVFSHAVMAKASPVSAPVDDLLLRLHDLDFVYPASVGPQRDYSFNHVLVQEAVYSTLLKGKRIAYHEAIGRAIEALYPDSLEEQAQVLVRHFHEAGNADKEVTYLDMANQKASKANAMEEAKRYFDEAMRLMDSLPNTAANERRRIALLVNQADVFLLLVKFPEYYDHLKRYEDVAVRVNDPWLLGAFYSRLTQCEWSFGNYDQAIQHAKKGTELCAAAGNTEDGGDTYLTWAWTNLNKGDYDQVFSLTEQVLRTMGTHFNLRDYTYTYAARSLAHTWCGRWDNAVAEAGEALKNGEEFSDRSFISMSQWVTAYAYLHKGDLTQAKESAERAIQIAPSPGDKMWSQATLACVQCRDGNPRQCVEILAEVIPVYRAAKFVSIEMFYALFLGEGYWLVGEHDKATQTLEECLETAERCGMKFFLGSTHRLLGEMALTTGPTQAEEPLAASHFEKSIAVLREIQAENELALAYAAYGRLHQQQGDVTQARTYLTQALEIFKRLGTLGEPGKVQQTLSALPAGS